MEPLGESTARSATAHAGGISAEATGVDSAAIADTNSELKEPRASGVLFPHINKMSLEIVDIYMQRSVKIVIFLIIIAGLATGVLLWQGKYNIPRIETEKARLVQNIQQKIVLDDLQPQSATESNSLVRPANTPDASTAPAASPTKHLLAMPFYPQAPHGNWDAFHEDMCEEASLLNAGFYLENKKLTLEEYERELHKMKDLEEKLLGEWKSNSIADIKKVSDEYFGGQLKSKIIDNPTVSDIEHEVATGHPVIVPLAGREVGNPNYTLPGPIYHMLVIKGYNEEFFITNDVGTRKGNSYVFAKKIIMEKMHDWNKTDIHKGAKKILVLYKQTS